MKRIVTLVLALVLALNIPVFAMSPMETALKAVNYRNGAHQTPNSNAWGEAMYQMGNMAVYADTGSAEYLQYSLDWAERANYSVDASAPVPEALLAARVYALLYNESGNAQLLDAATAAAETVTAESCETIEAIYMTLPLLGQLYSISGDESYISEIDELYTHLRATLYDEEANLFFENTAAAEAGYYWSRGNGFALSGLIELIEMLPDGDLNTRLTADYRELAAAVFVCRTEEGYYTRSLTDHDLYPGYETAGTSYITYGLAKGVNMGILERETYASALADGFKFIEDSLNDHGQVGFVQPRDSSTGEEGAALSASDMGGYGAGTVMLAGVETEKMNSGLTSDMKLLRIYGEKQGYSFGYDDATRTVTVEKDGVTVSLTIGSTSATVNGNEVALSKSPVVFNERTYISSVDMENIFE